MLVVEIHWSSEEGTVAVLAFQSDTEDAWID